MDKAVEKQWRALSKERAKLCQQFIALGLGDETDGDTHALIDEPDHKDLRVAWVAISDRMEALRQGRTYRLLP